MCRSFERGKSVCSVRVMYFYHDYNIFDCIDVTRSEEFVPYPGAFCIQLVYPKHIICVLLRCCVIMSIRGGRSRTNFTSTCETVRKQRISMRRLLYGIRRVHTIFHKVSFVTVDMFKYCQDKHYVRVHTICTYTQIRACVQCSGDS